MAKRVYDDLQIEMRPRQNGEYEVALLPTAAHGDPDPVRVTINRADVEATMDRVDRRANSEGDLLALGQWLGDRMLPVGIREPVLDAIGSAPVDGGVRLRLILRDPELAQLPWEYASVGRHGGGPSPANFLALDPKISIVRHVAMTDPWPAVGTASTEFRIVAAFADPPGSPKPLDLGTEEGAITAALDDLHIDGVTLSWSPVIEHATLRSLEDRLRTGAELFHFAGHGEFRDVGVDDRTGGVVGDGTLVLEGDEHPGGRFELSSFKTATLLRDAGVRVAVLGACNSGRRDGVSPWTGVAPALVRGGVAAIVAMQFQILDVAAIRFMGGFYPSITSGLSLDESMSAGRLSIFLRGEPGDVQWGVPVLYMRSSDGVVFPRISERELTTAETIRSKLHEVSVGVNKPGGRITGLKIRPGTDASGLPGVVVDVVENQGEIIGVDATGGSP